MDKKKDHHYHLHCALNDKVDFLRQPKNYPHTTSAVTAIETHMAWVFLTDQHAYKLKKPVFYPSQDFSTIDARYRDNKIELALNRRLASDIYLGLEPLAVNDDNTMVVGSKQPPCDWLLKMRRLPNDVCMDVMARVGELTLDHGAQLGKVLGEFYRTAEPAQISVIEYRERFLRSVEDNLEALRCFGKPLQYNEMMQICRRQKRFIDSRQSYFAECLYQSRVIEGHGDLRPEHIFFYAGIRIIDCLEFFRDLRLLDYFDDIAFLALECDRLGLPEIGEQIINIVADICAQPPRWALIYFYKSYRAAIRAKLAILHLRDDYNGDQDKWYLMTEEYLTLAKNNIDLALKK